jgi:hypothetical protein
LLCGRQKDGIVEVDGWYAEGEVYMGFWATVAEIWRLPIPHMCVPNGHVKGEGISRLFFAEDGNVVLSRSNDSTLKITGVRLWLAFDWFFGSGVDWSLDIG